MTIKDFFKQNPLRCILIIFTAAFFPAMHLVNTGLLAIITTAVKKWQIPFAFWLVAIMALVSLTDYFTQGWFNSLFTKQAEEYSVTLRRKIIQHYFYDQADHQVSQVQNRLTNDIEQVTWDYFASWCNIIMDISFFVFAFLLLLNFHWLLLVISIAMTIISLILPKLLNKQLQKATLHISSANKIYLDSLEKWLSGLAELRRYLAGAKLFKVIQLDSKKLEDANVKQVGLQQTLVVINGLISESFSFLLFILAGWLIINHHVQFGAWVVVGDCQYYLASSIEQMIAAYGRIEGSKSLNKQIADSATQSSVKQEKSVETPVSLMTENLSLKFPNGERLTFPDINVKRGEKVLLTGDSGTGKTSLLKILLGEITPTTGKVIFRNEKGQRIIPNMSKIGYIPQAPVLFPGSIADNMTMFNASLKSKLTPLIEKIQFAKDVFHFPTGLNTIINLSKLNVSGGQRQKIVLIRALVHQSKIILIDEGTSAIDQQATIEILREVTSSEQTVIFIAHSLNDHMRQMFDREIHLVKNKNLG
ncbi:ABC transporter ATP-binding protein [Lactobacillus sp. ESL0677]|uniref:ATP-binding cassette domain-containing protein n=1 Tax=Lactobacillus sp. ESL0677 TaxID=2983208 RepID=UPI0023F81FEF|nr:ABC transporter ATP-binding protein [Lactobacillus sp. ESL0677]WEV37295.1 ABC transporter ATP-binding protein [Lactobacillus sp. ESL0677]